MAKTQPQRDNAEQIECVGPKCDMTMEGTLKEARKAGWRGLVPRTAAAPQWSTVVGWCPDCAKTYGVLEARKEK